MTRQLVIVDPGGARDTIGGCHPGMWSPDDFASRLDATVRPSFYAVIAKIRAGETDSRYVHGADGSYSIHVPGPLGPLTAVSCVARWV